MKKFFALLVCTLLLSCCFVVADEIPDSTISDVFQNMSVEELQETDILLHEILNEKIIAGAVLHLSESEARLAVNKSLKLSVTCDGREINNKTKLTYASSDTSVATVSAGTVTAKGSGEAVITVTATFADGGVLSAECNVSVYVPVASVSIAPQSVTVLAGYSVDLSPQIKIQPQTATETGLIFRSEDETVATVDEHGVVTGINGGKVKITVTSAENTDKPKTAFANVTVTQPVSGIKLNRSEFTVGKGKAEKLTCTVQPSTATNQQVIWESANPKIATVAANGTVTGVSAGTTTITCTAKDGSGIKGEAKVTVITSVSRITISQKAVTIAQGGTYTLRKKIAPADASDKSVTWSSDYSRVASVDSNGTVTGKNPGKATITATAKDGSGAKASVTVFVEPKNPVIVTSIHWQTTWGVKNGKIGVIGENQCVNHTIKSFDFTVKCYNRYDSKPVVSYLSYSGPAIPAGREGKSKLTSSSISGFTSAYYVEITPTYVYYSDGTSQAIPAEAQYTSTFDMR